MEGAAIACASTSPALSNLLARRLDSQLNGIARKLCFACTHYADDGPGRTRGWTSNLTNRRNLSVKSVGI